MRQSERLRIAAVVFVFLWFFIGGIAHFAATATEMTFGPYSIPSGIIFEALVGDATGGVLGCLGTAQQFVVY